MLEKKIENFLLKHNYEFFHKNTTTSTMHDVKKFLIHNKKNCIYLSDEQTKGRGRRGNIWHSPVGNIYCSISFDNFLEIKEHFLFNALISISIKMSLEKFNANEIYFKWPNDIFYKKKKFSGMISEIIDIDSINSHIIMGFGINMISTNKFKNYNSTYLKAFCNIESKEEFFLVFIEILFFNLQELQKGKKNQLMNTFSESLMLINEDIKINVSNILTIKGIFRGINDDGSLRLEKDGKIENIYNGSIEL